MENFLPKSGKNGYTKQKLTLKLRPKPARSNADHAAVLDAIRRGDSDEARQTHRLHREESAEMLIALLEDLGLTQM